MNMVKHLQNGRELNRPMTPDMEKMLNEVIGRPMQGMNHGFTPTMDVCEKEGCFEVHCCLPGCNKEDVEICIEDNHLRLRGERKQPEDVIGFHLRENGFGKFDRTCPMPANCNEEEIEAHMENGLLRIVIPKQENHKEKKIEIK